MSSIEVVWFVVVFVFVLVALARGYHRELGTTIIILLAAFIMFALTEKVDHFVSTTMAPYFRVDAKSETVEAIELLFFLTFFLVTLMGNYIGFGISAGGVPTAKGINRFFLNVAVGAVNGILTVSVVWFYFDYYHYPYTKQARLFFPETMSGFARSIVHALSTHLDVLLGTDVTYVGVVAALLLLFIVIRK